MARAAEHLVCSDILTRGMVAFHAAEGLSYDLVAEIGCLRRVQVKSTIPRLRPARGKGKIYDYNVYRFHDKNGFRRYVGAVDLMAFVALDRRLIFYARPEQMTRELRILPQRLTREFCELSWTEATRGWHAGR